MSQELSLTRSLQIKRDLEEPYPSSQAIFERARNFQGAKEFSDLFKEDMIEVTRIVAQKVEHQLDTPPYLKALLRHGLKHKETEEKVNPLVETSMIFTSVIGVEVLNKVANVNEKVDWVVLELAGREVGVRANLHCLEGMFAAQDTWADLMEEKGCHHDEQLTVLGSSRDRLDNCQTLGAKVHLPSGFGLS